MVEWFPLPSIIISNAVTLILSISDEMILQGCCNERMGDNQSNKIIKYPIDLDQIAIKIKFSLNYSLEYLQNIGVHKVSGDYLKSVVRIITLL